MPVLPDLEPSHSILLKVEFRVGQPGSTCRAVKDIKAVYPTPPQVSFQLSPNEDTLCIVRERVRKLQQAIKPPLSKKRYVWSGDIYIKPFRWAGQRRNELLDDDNLRYKVLTAWRSEVSSSTAASTEPNQCPVTLFVYLQDEKAKNAGGKVSRGISNQANASSFAWAGGSNRQSQQPLPAAICRSMEILRDSEPLATATMARGVARQGPTTVCAGDSVLEIPYGSTLLQTDSIDRQHADIRSVEHISRRNLPELIELPITLRIPVDVLRRGLGLPDISLRSAFDERLNCDSNPPPPSQLYEHDINPSSRGQNFPTVDVLERNGGRQQRAMRAVARDSNQPGHKSRRLPIAEQNSSEPLKKRRLHSGRR